MGYSEFDPATQGRAAGHAGKAVAYVMATAFKVDYATLKRPPLGGKPTL